MRRTIWERLWLSIRTNCLFRHPIFGLLLSIVTVTFTKQGSFLTHITISYSLSRNSVFPMLEGRYIMLNITAFLDWGRAGANFGLDSGSHRYFLLWQSLLRSVGSSKSPASASLMLSPKPSLCEKFRLRGYQLCL